MNYMSRPRLTNSIRSAPSESESLSFKKKKGSISKRTREVKHICQEKRFMEEYKARKRNRDSEGVAILNGRAAEKVPFE